MSVQLSKGLLKEIGVTDEKRELRREVTRLRSQLVDHRVSVILQIKSKLLYFGMMSPVDNRQLTEKYMKELESKDLPTELLYSLDTLIEQWRYYTAKINEVNQKLREREKEDQRT